MSRKLATLTEREEKALYAILDAVTQLRADGWRDALYAPRDELLELIEAGSTGVHKGTRDDLGFWIHADGDSLPSSPIMFRLAGSGPTRSGRGANDG